MMHDWRQLNIDTRGKYAGKIKTTCPTCSESRRNKRDRCLSLNLDDGLYCCHNCGWSGKAWANEIMRDVKIRKQYRKPQYVAETAPQDKLVAWFQNRGISETVVRRNRIEARSVQMYEGGKPERVIAFPYLRGGEVVNVQYRTPKKQFKLEGGCELILYGLDDVQAGEPLIIVEGQIDKLSLEESGYLNCVSVPNGASGGILRDADWLTSAQSELDSASYFILAGDADEPGRLLQDELARRLGPEKCWRAEWPEGCKDANDVLLKHGRAAVIEAIECAQPLPIVGIVTMTDLYPDIEELYRTGIQPGVHCGWDALAKIYKPRLGEWTALTGAPGSGKSTFLDAMAMNLAIGQGWRFAMFSPEQLPLKQHAAQLLELWQGQPFSKGLTERMKWTKAEEGINALGDLFKFIQPEDQDVNVDGVLRLAKACVTRYGINGLVIDPWNEIGHARPAGMSETDFIDVALSKIRRFARLYHLHVWLIIHPTKQQKDPKTDDYPVATPYDLHGSAHWFNKADMILSLWRNKKDYVAPLQVHSQKVRFRENGELGVAELFYDKITGRLSDTAHTFGAVERVDTENVKPWRDWKDAPAEEGEGIPF